MAEYNITMNQLNAEGTYDILNPTTKAKNINDVTSANDYGLESNANIDDILTLLKNSIQSSNGNLTLPDGTSVVSQIENALGNPAKMETGSYTGTGTSGSSNPNSLTFGFIPEIVFIISAPGEGSYYRADSIIVATIGLSTSYQDNGYIENGVISTGRFAKMSGTTLSWYGNSSQSQCNYKNNLYNYIAFG